MSIKETWLDTECTEKITEPTAEYLKKLPKDTTTWRVSSILWITPPVFLTALLPAFVVSVTRSIWGI